jgi:predicted RNA-binding protein YlqC (UPF0109 family)
MSTRSKSSSKKPSKHTDSIFHRDLKDLEIGKNLRKLGNIRVTEWEFSDILPAVNRVAQTEIDIDGFVRRAANYRVTEWDLKDLLGKREQRTRRPDPSPSEMLKLSDELTRFLRFVTRNLIDQTDMAEIRTNQPFPNTLMIKMVLCKKDAAALIGHGGHTASAIRAIIKDVARKRGARASLRILTEEEDSLEA